MTMTKSNLWESGNLVMRSMEIEEKGIGVSTAKGESPGMTG